jgi:hypothetical protein
MAWEMRVKKDREFVIPGQPAGLSPESIIPVAEFSTKRCHRGYGFRARARARPGMTVVDVA